MSLTFSEKMEKFRMIVNFESQILALFDTFWLFLTPPHHINSQNSMILKQKKNLGPMSFEAKIEILSPSFLFYIAPGNSSISKVRH